MADLIIIRVLFIAVLGCTAFFLRPLDLSGPIAALVGGLVGAGVVVFEYPHQGSQPEALDRRRVRQRAGDSGRLPDLAGSQKRHAGFAHGAVLAVGAAGLDDLLRPDRRRGQGRYAQPGGAGRIVRRGKNLQEHVQDPGHQRDHRRPHRGYRRDRIHRRRHRDPPVRPARAATGGRFLRLDEAQPRPPWPGYPPAPAEDVRSSTSRSWKTISQPSAKWI